MTDGIYLGMNGAVARLAQLDAIADNLANAETPGFRAARPHFSSFLMSKDGVPTGAHVVLAADGVDTRPGEARVTGRPLDVRLEDKAWLTVSMADGAQAFTRDGRIDLDGDSRLVIAGHPVLGTGGQPIFVPPGAEVRIREDGSVLAGGTVIDKLGLVSLEGELSRVGPTVVRGAPVPLEYTRVQVGALEGSNARALESTVELISAQRAYDHAMQAIQASRRLDERGVEAAKIRG